MVEQSAPDQSESQRARLVAVKAALDLKRQGWAIVENVLTQEECKEYTSRMLQWLEDLGAGFSRKDPETWKPEHMPEMFNGIINSLEISHQDFVWKVRSHPFVLKIFEELWGTNGLLVSFDSVNACPVGHVPGKSWLHCDQRPAVKGLSCVQGLVNLVDVSPGTTGTLLVKTGSHEGHESFFKTASNVPVEKQATVGDFYLFRGEEVAFYDQYQSVPLEGRAGSLFLWDSRTAHMNMCTKPTTEFRHVVYVCMQPATLTSENELLVKKEAWDNYLTTTHWPAYNIQLHKPVTTYFGESVGVAGGKNVSALRNREHVESPTIRQLAGLEPYASVHHSTPLLKMSEEELLKELGTAEE